MPVTYSPTGLDNVKAKSLLSLGNNSGNARVLALGVQMRWAFDISRTKQKPQVTVVETTPAAVEIKETPPALEPPVKETVVEKKPVEEPIKIIVEPM